MKIQLQEVTNSLTRDNTESRQDPVATRNGIMATDGDGDSVGGWRTIGATRETSASTCQLVRPRVTQSNQEYQEVIHRAFRRMAHWQRQLLELLNQGPWPGWSPRELLARPW